VATTFTLTLEQRQTFDRVGVLRLPGFYPAADIAGMADRLWSDLERRYGVLRKRPATWTVVRPAQFQAVERAGAFAALGSQPLFDLADILLGAGAWDKPRRWGHPLVTFPSPVWNLPRVMWHLDYPAEGPGSLAPAMRVFVFLEPVRPHGGGTLYVAGSHQLIMDLAAGEARPVPSAKMRERLKPADPWFTRLWATLGDEVRGLLGEASQVRGVDVAVEEMTGEAGDLILMHPLMLHGLSHNALDRPRMMLVGSLARRGDS
jgi:hypothetical protein